MSELADRLRGGLFLSSMMGSTTGAFVAAHGHGAAMVQLGALVADASDRSHDARFLLPVTEAEMVPVLRSEVGTARASLGDTPIALNAAAGDLESCLRMARAFHAAGGDLFELNCHGGYGKLHRRGLLSAMVLPENRSTMLEWLDALCRLEIPVVVKLNTHTRDVDFPAVLEELRSIPALFGIHFNVRGADRAEPNVDFVRDVRSIVPGALWCSGHVTRRRHVEALFRAGADCVGVAQGVLGEEGIIARLAGQ